MKNFKVSALLLLILVVIGVFLYSKSDHTQTKDSYIEQSSSGPYKIITTIYPSKKDKKNKNNFVFKDPPAIEIKKEVSRFMTEHKIGKSYRLLKEVKAIDAKKYQATLGKKLDEHGGFIFYIPQKNSPNQSMPVAINASNQKLYAVSQVFHIEKISQEERLKLQNAGHQEYYYHSRLKLMSIINRPEEWEQKYSNLLAQGYKVKLEVIKEPNHIK